MEELASALAKHHELVEGSPHLIIEHFGFTGLLLLVAFILYVIFMFRVYGILEERWTRLLTDAELEDLKTKGEKSEG